MATESIESVIDTTPNAGTSQVPAGGTTPTGDEIEIEVVDDTPEEDRGRPARAPGTQSSVPSDEEIGQYTKGVQDRLRQMKWEYHEERRAKEQWAREHGAAVDFAKRVHMENQQLRKLVSEGHKAVINTTYNAAQGEMAALQEALKNALERGETAQAAELQGKLAQAAARAEAQRHIQPINFPEEQINWQQQQPPQQQGAPQLSDTMQEWMRNNPWFNQDKRMTSLAFGIHEELIARGIPVESPAYFKEIDAGIRGAFPSHFEGEGKTTRQQAPTARRTVAGVSRTQAGGGPRKVQLTQSELAVAKRLGISTQAYAAEKARLENLDG